MLTGGVLPAMGGWAAGERSEFGDAWIREPAAGDRSGLGRRLAPGDVVVPGRIGFEPRLASGTRGTRPQRSGATLGFGNVVVPERIGFGDMLRSKTAAVLGGRCGSP
ncbi:MAG: hypothetical protein AAF752_15990, partial [Bacteroidota bacterium]